MSTYLHNTLFLSIRSNLTEPKMRFKSNCHGPVLF